MPFRNLPYASRNCNCQKMQGTLHAPMRYLIRERIASPMYTLDAKLRV